MECGDDGTAKGLGTMRFNITFIDSLESPEYYVGEISWPGFRENFHASKGYWSKSEYESQWQNAVKQVHLDSAKSCFIVSMEDPTTANFVRTWVLYRISDSEMAIQEHIVFLEELTVSFDPAAPWDAIADRDTTDEEGNPISEWIISMDCISD